MRHNITGAPLRRLLAAVTLGALALLFAQALTDFGGPWADAAIDDGIYFALELGGAIACLVRAVLVRDRRPAWICIGSAILVYALGDAIWGLAFERTTCRGRPTSATCSSIRSASPAWRCCSPTGVTASPRGCGSTA